LTAINPQSLPSMKRTREFVILVVEDDEGHARLIEKNLTRAGLHNDIQRFANGQAVLDFLFRQGPGPHRTFDKPYLLLLDIRMPQVDGIEVLRQVKADPELRKVPVIMLTTTDDPREVERCHQIGCSSYIVKPVDYDKFAEAIKRLGLFISLVEVPEIDGGASLSQTTTTSMITITIIMTTWSVTGWEWLGELSLGTDIPR
jgi:CheY-like chemotaxis protein